MSTAASIALMVFVIEVIVLFAVLLIGLIVAGVGVVESTGHTRRFLRRRAKDVDRIHKRVEDVAERHVMTPLVKVERATAWTRTFVQSFLRKRE